MEVVVEVVDRVALPPVPHLHRAIVSAYKSSTGHWLPVHCVHMHRAVGEGGGFLDKRFRDGRGKLHSSCSCKSKEFKKRDGAARPMNSRPTGARPMINFSNLFV